MRRGVARPLSCFEELSAWEGGRGLVCHRVAREGSPLPYGSGRSPKGTHAPLIGPVAVEWR